MFAIRAAVSEIQLILTLNGKLALIGYSLGHNYLIENPVGLKLCRTTPRVPKDHFCKSRPKLIFFVKLDTTMPNMVRIAQLMIL